MHEILQDVSTVSDNPSFDKIKLSLNQNTIGRDLQAEISVLTANLYFLKWLSDSQTNGFF